MHAADRTFWGARHLPMIFYVIVLPTVICFFGLHIWGWGRTKQSFKDLDFAFTLLLIKQPLELAELFSRAVGLEGCHVALAILIACFLWIPKNVVCYLYLGLMRIFQGLRWAVRQLKRKEAKVIVANAASDDAVDIEIGC